MLNTICLQDQYGHSVSLVYFGEFQSRGINYTVYLSPDEPDEQGQPSVYILVKTTDASGDEHLSMPDPDILPPLMPFLSDFLNGRQHYFTASEIQQLQIVIKEV